MDYNFHWRLVWNDLPLLLASCGTTIELTVFSVVIGTVLAILLALGGNSNLYPLRVLNTAWVELARNTPALFQVYFAYFGLGALHINLSAYVAVLGAIAFNNAGYLSETFRGGLAAVNPTQLKAGLSLAMSRPQVYARIVLPQVFRIVYYPWTNQVMWALLNTSLGMFIGLQELTGEASMLQAVSFRTFEFFVVTAVIYYVIAKLILGSAKIGAWRLFRD